MAINETAVPAVLVRRARDWWFPVRVVVVVTAGVPLLLVAALLSAMMDGPDDRQAIRRGESDE